MKQTVPSESYEQERLVIWLEANEYKFTAIPHGMFTRSYAVKARNTREGVRAGFPDIVICLKRKPLLFAVEMKRITGGRVSAEQNEWIKALNQRGVRALVCNGFEEARAAIERGERE